MEVKRCTSCKQFKLLTEFARNSRMADGLFNMCRTCKRAYNAAYYERTKEVHNPGRAERRQRMVKEARTELHAYLLTHPCVDCGETDIVVLDFDHLGDKIANISAMVAAGIPWVRIQEEIVKCEVVCANDHRRRTARQFGWTKLLVSSPGSSEAEQRTLNPRVGMAEFPRGT